ncbi:hypothetical protein TOTORO_02070 [Serratia phage vB_SmaS-Totoro]|nr:hypothetical protein TOTORO_02070 [Serratia phage vB_SmaS-Totoro]
MAVTTRRPGEPGTEKRKVNEDRERLKDTIKLNPILFMEHLRLCSTLKPLCELYDTNVSQLTHVVHELFMHTPRQMMEPNRRLCLVNRRITEGEYREIPNLKMDKEFGRAVEDLFPGYKYLAGKAAKSKDAIFDVYGYRSDNVLFIAMECGDQSLVATCYISPFEKMKAKDTRPLNFPKKAFEAMFGIC